MEAADVAKLIAGGESLTVEFKRGTPQGALSDNDLVEAVVCLANGDGGVLLIGVEDDGTVTGAAPRGRNKEQVTPAQLTALVLNKTYDPLPVEVHLVAIDGKDVFAIDVPKPDAPVCTSGGVYKRRSLRMDGTPQCVPYRPSLLVSTARSLAGRDYAEIPLPGLTLDHLDLKELDRFRRLAASSAGDRLLADSADQEILRALRVQDPDGRLTVGALLLFGRTDALAERLPTVEVLWQIERDGQLVRNDTVREPLLKTAENVLETIAPYNSKQEITVGVIRLDLQQIPDVLAREAVVNALVHRDYAELGPIQIKLTPEIFRVSSPGGFPGGLNAESILEETRPRSPLLAEAFKRAGLAERTGRGVARIYESLLRSGRPVPSYSSSGQRRVVLSAQFTDADFDMVRFVSRWEDGSQPRLALDHLRILKAIKDFGVPCSAGEVEELATPGVNQAQTQLGRLVQLGLVETQGVGQRRKYFLSDVFFRLREDRTSYIRATSGMRVRHEELILDYVVQYGAINRRQAADLCHIGPQQASRVLKQLVDSGRLGVEGERRWTRYVLPKT